MAMVLFKAILVASLAGEILVTVGAVVLAADVEDSSLVPGEAQEKENNSNTKPKMRFMIFCVLSI